MPEVEQPIVETLQGVLRGRKTVTSADFPCYSFQGIPYAKPPVGELRFKIAQPSEPWTGIHDASKEGSSSASFSKENKVIGSEDCLYLNVYTPELPEKNKTLKPVMFWIHGGGLYQGCANADCYGPDFLMNEDVVVVTFNYRLGVFGFLNCEDTTIGVQCDAGISDIIMALKWVQKNIDRFNGDPNNVTLWGQSGGAILGHILIMLPETKDLFHKVILQSGTSFCISDPTIKRVYGLSKLASFAGFETDNEKEAYNYLKTLTTDQILNSFIKLQECGNTKYENVTSSEIEKTILEKQTILNQDPELYYVQNRVNTVPMIIGSNTMDGMIFASKQYLDSRIPLDIPNPEVLIPQELRIPRNTKKSLELSNNIKKYYYGNETPSRRNLEKYSKYQTDVNYNLQIKRIIQLHQSISTSPIYLYKFEFESRLNEFKKSFGLTTIPGVCHAEELAYLFKAKNSKPFAYRSPEDVTQYRMIKMWTNFAKTGDPNPIDVDPLIQTKWLPVNSAQLNYLSIGKVLVHKKKDPDYIRMKFWDELYAAYFMEYYQHEFAKGEKSIDIHTQMKILKTCNTLRNDKNI